jgi:cobalt-zinc-cadmium efflux system membrane fusion protein
MAHVQRSAWKLTGALLALALCAGCSHPSATSEAPAPDAEHKQDGTVVVPASSPLRAKLEVEPSRSDLGRTELGTPAVVEAVPGLTARIFPPVSGHLLKLSVQQGDSVVKGQVLATINSPDYMSAQSDYSRAKSTLDLTERALKRQNQLLDAKIAAKRDVEQAQNDYDSARSGLLAAEGRLRAYGIDPLRDRPEDPLVLRAPVSGRVIDMAAGIGEFRSDTTAPLMTIADLSTVWITASVQEKDIRFVTKGQEVKIAFSAYPGQDVTSQVETVGETLDPDTRATKVRIVLPNPAGRYRPGMYATVTFLGFPEPEITVPTSALVQIGGAAFVFQQLSPGTYKAIEVEPGEQHGGRTAIRRGLGAGVPVVVQNGVLLQ